MRRKRLLVPIAISLAMLGVSCDQLTIRDILGPPPDVPVVDVPVILQANGSILIPELTLVQHGQRVRWTQVGGDRLEIHLNSVPGIDRTLSGSMAAEIEITRATPPAIYKYDVTVRRGNESFVLDPRLMVREEGR